MRTVRAAQQRVARSLERGRHERRAGAARPAARTPRPCDRRARRLPGQVVERVDEAAPELLGQDDVPEAVPGLRVCRRRAARGTARPGAAARGRRATTVIARAATQRATSRGRRRCRRRPRARTARSAARAAGSASGCRPPGRTPPRPRPAPGRAPRPPRRRAGGAGSPASARWRACASACVPMHQTTGVSARPSPAMTPSGGRPRQGPHEIDRDRRGDGDDSAANRFIRKRRLAEGRQQHVREPAQQDVGREAGRVGRAQHRRDRLELGGVPEAEAGQQRQASRDECDGPRPATGGTQVTRARRHHPSRRPQATPHALTATETTTRADGERHGPAAAGDPIDEPRESEGDEDERERHGVVAEAVAELDPALAEVHEVRRSTTSRIASTAPVTSRRRP